MSAVGLDTDAARSVAVRLRAGGDDLSGLSFDLRSLCESLQVEGWIARRQCEIAAERLWTASAFLALVADLADGSDTSLDASVVTRLMSLAGGLAGRRGPFGAFRAALGSSPPDGDVGGTFDAELRSPFAVVGSNPLARSRSALIRTLADLSDPRQIRQDEFELIQLAPDRYIVVLPGVTDLSSPDLFLSDTNRTVRDLDQFAVPSSRSSDVDDNRYARMVWDGLEAAGVPHGSSLMIVGHSFGADTALDLAADPGFNGRDFRVTHVVAAGYYSQPQLRGVAAGTDVLVLQNHRDTAVIVEGLGQSSAVKSVDSRWDAIDDAWHGDPIGAAGHLWDAWQHDLDTLVDVGEYAYDHSGDVRDIAIGAGWSDWDMVAGAAADLVWLEPRIEHVGDHVVVDVFEGGGDGAGHHPTNYIDHVASIDDPSVVAFLESVDRAGYTSSGSVVAIDVSVPR